MASTLLPAAFATDYEFSEADVKAAYIVNLAKFTHWEKRQNKTVLSACVSGDLRVFNALQALELKATAKRLVKPELVELPGKVTHCDMLYISDLDSNKKPALLASLAKESVVTISDIPGFIADGGMIALKKSGGRLLFDLNLPLSRLSGIRFESRLARLANNATRFASESAR